MTDAFIYHCGDVVGYDLQLSRLYCERCGKVGSPEQFGVVRERKELPDMKHKTPGAAANRRGGAGNTSVLGVALLVVIAAALVVTPAHGQTIFAMNDGGVANAGWPGGAVPTTATHDRVHVPTGGPNGGPAWEFRQRYAPQVEGYGGEFYWGWNGTVEPDPPQGARRFYRWRMRFDPATNWRGLYWQDGRAIDITNKILMVGDGCGRNRCRVIVSYRGIPDGSAAEIRVAIDGGETPTPNVLLRKGEWLDLQIETDSSTSGTSADGAFKLWLNNNNYDAPTAQITGIQLNPTRWGYVFFGAYNNNGLAADGAQTFRVAGFHVASTFDAAFHVGGTTPPPPPPGDPCVVSPISVTDVAWPGSAEGTRSGRFTWTAPGVITTLQSAEWLWGPQRLRVTDQRGCVATVTR